MIKTTKPYEYLINLPTFTIEDLDSFVNHRKTGYVLLKRLIQKGLVVRVRSNLYSCVDQDSRKILASRAQIATGINSGSYLGIYSALSYHLFGTVKGSEITVFSDNIFNYFEFDGIKYTFIPSPFSEGIVTGFNVRVTDIERSVIDCMKEICKKDDLERLNRYMNRIEKLDEEKLKNYLAIYNMQILYQKAGYVLSDHKERLELSNNFFEFCESNINKSVRYLCEEAKENGVHISRWRLMVPRNDSPENP